MAEEKKRGRKKKDIVENTNPEVELSEILNDEIFEPKTIDAENVLADILTTEVDILDFITPEQLKEAGEAISEMIDKDILEKVIAAENVPMPMCNEKELIQESPHIFTQKEMDDLPEVIQVKEIKEISEQAKKWKSYLPMHKLTPKQFLIKYPYHQARKYIEELIEKE